MKHPEPARICPGHRFTLRQHVRLVDCVQFRVDLLLKMGRLWCASRRYAATSWVCLLSPLRDGSAATTPQRRGPAGHLRIGYGRSRVEQNNIMNADSAEGMVPHRVGAEAKWIPARTRVSRSSSCVEEVTRMLYANLPRTWINRSWAPCFPSTRTSEQGWPSSID